MPKIVDHEQRHEEIVRALWQVIAEHGIEGVSLRVVAQAAGVSIGRIQHYFASREALVLAGLTRLIDQAVGAYQGTSDAPPRDRLFHVLSQQVPRTEPGRMGVAVWYAYLATAITDTRIRQILAEALRVGETECAAHVRAMREVGAAEALAVSRRLLALSDGLTLRVLAGGLDADEAIAVLHAEVDAL
ncbi:TetR/AcrR family transcriptional regulator [Tenggerimyces flavus]|uniref:TetR/AcrR family transcriptional regulator n=1 Tax=Tenggerimyces flavus TaxID=1708749 RepID=A0ABV7Y755_9ACTN|nr:TetR family transcriptional regulator C-terminal domain-containing protein [Tenggerimyces flavus]MBM7785049.1 AcrR family transcriptional regulator [Tenggerimyces flavus]